MKLWKTHIVIWSDFDPGRMDLSRLAQEAETGEAYCSRMEAASVPDAKLDLDWDGTEFFGEHDDEAADAA